MILRYVVVSFLRVSNSPTVSVSCAFPYIIVIVGVKGPFGISSVTKIFQFLGTDLRKTAELPPFGMDFTKKNLHNSLRTRVT